MKNSTRLPLSLLLLTGTSATGFAAVSLVGSPTFFNPDFQARRPGATSGIFTVAVNDSLYTNPPQSSGPMIWTHSAAGFAQTRTGVDLGLTTFVVDGQLAAYSETIGNSLVFGREITTDGGGLTGALLTPALEDAANAVAGASVDYFWRSNATLSGITVDPGQVYQVSFTVGKGDGLPVTVLSAATFGITDPSVNGEFGAGSTSLNLLDVVGIGSGAQTGEFTFNFTSTTALTSLNFEFEANTVADVSLLGGTEPNKTVLTFSNFAVTPIPEPGSVALIALGAIAGFRRRR